MKYANSSKTIVHLAIACVIFTLRLHGAGLEYLSGKASAVVIGSVLSRTEGETQVSFTINVARVMAGSVADAAVSVIHPWAGAVRGPARTGGQPLYGIWFLSMNASGTWDTLISRPSQGMRTVFGLFLPASSAPLSAPYAYPAGTPLLDALVYETAAGVQSAPAQSPDVDPEVLLGAFDYIDTPAVQAMLATCLASSNPAVQAVGLAGNLERGVPGVIQQLVQLWPTISVDPHQADVVSALRNSWRDPTPAAVQQLVSMTAAALPAYSGLRAAAIRALAAIHTKETLPFLATLLASIDFEEQERAVYGLSSFANGCPMQTNGNVVSLTYLQCINPAHIELRTQRPILASEPDRLTRNPPWFRSGRRGGMSTRNSTESADDALPKSC